MCVCCVEGSTIVSSCFPEVSFFLFSNIPFTFPLLKFFFTFLFFVHLITWKFEISFHLKLHSDPQYSMVCLRGPLLCPAASWGDFVSNMSFTFSFAKVFSFTFLASFMWTSQKFPISQNIWYLIKTQLKNITQTIFQGGSPWATLIHNSMVCLRGPLLCPAASWGYFFFKQSLYLFLCY